jgi:hypothetical protein
MSKLTRIVVVTVGVLILLVVAVITALPMFLNADSFRTRIQADLSKSLGRQVTMSKLSLSVWSGGLVAQNVQIADDPSFGTQPFLQTDTLKIGVELFPLLLHKEVHIRSFTLVDPKVDLLRSTTGKWNYSTIGTKANKPAAPASSSSDTLSNLTVGHISITDGSVTVGEQGTGAAAAQNRQYQKVNLDVSDFGSAKASSFTLSATLPGDGTISAKGSAGPINQRDTADTPFTVHVEAKHIDPLAAGFVDSSAGISGLVDSFTLEGAWTGEQLHIAKLLVGSPHITMVEQAKTRTAAQPAPHPSGGRPGQKTARKNEAASEPAAQPAAQNSSFLNNLSVDDAEINNGSVTMTTAGKTGAPVVYQQIDAKLSNLTPTTASPFSLSAQLPGGGSVSASGKAGPFNQANNAATPINAQATLKGIHLATSGVLPPDAGIEGVLDMQAQVQSDGKNLQANGNAQVNGIALARNASPAAKPLNVQFVVVKDELANRGQIQHAVVSTGGVSLNIAGTFESSGPSTDLNLKVNGSNMPVDAIEAFLPALGVHLPEGSRLEGGTLTTAVAVTGSSASPAIAGPVRLDNSRLAGFDLGAKLGTLSKLTGGKIGAATGSGTNIKLFSTDVQEQGGNIRTDKLDVDVTGVGTATGSGTISAAGALDYAVILKLNGLAGGGSQAAAPAATQTSSKAGLGGLAGGLSGLTGGGASGAGALMGGTGALSGALLSHGIPVQIGGTTTHPTFAPNLGGLTRGMGAGAVKGLVPGSSNGTQKQSNPLKNPLGGLLGH